MEHEMCISNTPTNTPSEHTQEHTHLRGTCLHEHTLHEHTLHEHALHEDTLYGRRQDILRGGHIRKTSFVEVEEVFVENILAMLHLRKET